MIKAIIVDDEKHCVDRLRELIARHAADTVVIKGVFETVESGISAMRELRPDLVFLDVQIRDKTGFDLLQATRDIPCAVVFTTAYDQYAIQAFRFSAIDYLLKPVMAEDLLPAIDKMSRKALESERSKKLENLLFNLTDAAQKRIAVPVETGLLFIQVSDVVRCESSSNYTLVFTKDRQKLVVSRTLKEFEVMLAPYRFFRVHHSHLINLQYIKSYNKGKGGNVTLLDNSVIEVSTRRKEEFLKALG
jgi:two-component system LytT family response regulator